MIEPVLKAENVHKSYSTRLGEKTQVLKGLDIEILNGEFAAIMGPSGAGKSTLLYILGSLDNPDEGTITYYRDGREYNFTKMKEEELALFRNKTIGFVFQFHHLLPEFTALENVMMPALISGMSPAKAGEKANLLLSEVGVENRSMHKPMELSGGEQQRVAIARALINDPQLVLADEPTGNLDSKNSKAVLDLIQSLRDKYNLTFLVATHSNEVAAIGERIFMIGDGKIVGQ